METLSHFTPEIEIYSIDEAFLNLAGFGFPLTNYGREMQRTVRQWTGMPVSVGIAGTKTLTKVANYLAKRSGKAKGVLDLTNESHLNKALARTPLEKVWNVGIKTAIKLKRFSVPKAL